MCSLDDLGVEQTADAILIDLCLLLETARKSETVIVFYHI